MAQCHEHNLRERESGMPRPFGIRVALRPDDPFRKLLGADWSRSHWYETLEEREAELAEMSRRHEYSRPGDQPSLLFEKVEKLAERRIR